MDADVRVLVCDAQLVEFDEWEQAYQYISSRRVATDNSVPRPFVGGTAVTDDYAVVPAMDNGKHFTNAGACGPVSIQLAMATEGQRYTFTRVASHCFQVAPCGAERFRSRCTRESLKLDDDGESVTVQCLQNGLWDITASYDPNQPATSSGQEP
jgi:hypothetical protein